MVIRQSGRRTLAGQLFIGQVLLVGVVLVGVAAASLAQSHATFERVEGRRVTALAEQIATTPLVRERLAQPEARSGLATFGLSIATQSDVTSVTFAEPTREVRFSTDPWLDSSDLPSSVVTSPPGAGWAGTSRINGSDHLVAQVPVLADSANGAGELLGTVIVAERQPSAWERLAGASSYLLTYLGIALLVGLAGSWLLSRRIRRQTRGLEPGEIAGLADHREAVLRGIAEGVIAVDPRQRVTIVNDVARDLLGLSGDVVGSLIEDLGIDGRLHEVLVNTSAAGFGRDAVVIRGGRVLVMNTTRVQSDSHHFGSVTTMRDRTDLADLERQLGTFQNTTQLLRAQGHEFANQLHTIGGLIQIGAFDDVVSFVNAVTDRRISLDLRVRTRIADPAVAALIMAKTSQAAERHVELRLASRANLGRLTPEDSVDVSTVVGNLIDNALDAVTGPDHHASWVEVSISQDPSRIEVVVTDSGPGVADDIAAEVFAHGFTTKSAKAGERGIGLALTRMLCEQRGGEVVLDQSWKSGDAETGDAARRGARFVARLGITAGDEPARTFATGANL